MTRVLVTGGTGGIGAGITQLLRQAGPDVFTCSRAGSGSVRCDVTRREDVAAMLQEIGPVDVLVNNAGGIRTAPFLQITEEDWEWQFRLNVTSIYYCVQAFLPAMLEKKWGRIINIASTAGKIGGPYLTAYVTSKHAVIGFTKALALEVATKGITVNAVCPSFVDTPMLRDSIRNISQKTKKTESEIVERFQSRNPQNRLVTVDEVATTVKFLIENGGINGQAISICGGET